MALYNDQGMMDAERLKYLIGRFQDKPEMVASLQRQLDATLGQQTAQQVAQPVDYQQRAGSAERWDNVNPNVKAFLAKRGATSIDQQAAERAYLNSQQGGAQPRVNETSVWQDPNYGQFMYDDDYVGTNNNTNAGANGVYARRNDRKYSDENKAVPMQLSEEQEPEVTSSYALGGGNINRADAQGLTQWERRKAEMDAPLQNPFGGRTLEVADYMPTGPQGQMVKSDKLSQIAALAAELSSWSWSYADRDRKKAELQALIEQYPEEMAALGYV